MATKLSIINRAYRYIGQSPVELITPEDPTQLLVRGAYEDNVEWCLRCHAWSHAQKWAKLAKLEEDPPFGFANNYAVPADCLYVIDIHQDEDLTLIGEEYALVGNNLYTNADPCLCRYITTLSNMAFWPSDFCDLISLRIAIELAPTLVPGDSNITDSLSKRFQLALEVAKRNDMAASNLPQIDQKNCCSFLQRRWNA